MGPDLQDLWGRGHGIAKLPGGRGGCGLYPTSLPSPGSRTLGAAAPHRVHAPVCARCGAATFLHVISPSYLNPSPSLFMPISYTVIPLDFYSLSLLLADPGGGPPPPSTFVKLI